MLLDLGGQLLGNSNCYLMSGDGSRGIQCAGSNIHFTYFICSSLCPMKKQGMFYFTFDTHFQQCSAFTTCSCTHISSSRTARHGSKVRRRELTGKLGNILSCLPRHCHLEFCTILIRSHATKVGSTRKRIPWEPVTLGTADLCLNALFGKQVILHMLGCERKYDLWQYE